MEEGPALGRYDPLVTARGSSSTVASEATATKQSAAPFGSRLPRGKVDDKADLPGPGAYDPLVRRNGKASDVSALLGSSLSASASRLSLCSAGGASAAARPSSPFASRTKKILDPNESIFGVRKSRGDTPGVATYEPPPSDFDVRPQSHPLGDSAAFRSDSFARPSDAVSALAAKGVLPAQPGPGFYSPRALRDGSGASTSARAERTRGRESPVFKSRLPARPDLAARTDTPGPGAYDDKTTRFGARREVAESAYEIGYVVDGGFDFDGSEDGDKPAQAAAERGRF